MVVDRNKSVHRLRQHGNSQQQNTSFIQQIKTLYRLGTSCEVMDKIPARQGPALVMSLEGKALDTILEFDDKDMLDDNGITTIINKLNSIYKKGELNEKFEDLECFESYKRSPETQMQQFVA